MRDMISPHITDERDGQKPRFDPPWRKSDTGTSCFADREKFIDINEGNTGGGPVKFAARESGLISSCNESLKGGDWWEAVDILRQEYGYKIPLLIPDVNTEMLNEDGETYNQTPHWAIVKAGVAFGIIDEDDLKEKEKGEGTYLPISEKPEKYNQILRELEERGFDHGREEYESGKELTFDFEVRGKPGEFVVNVKKDILTLSIKGDDGDVVYPETKFDKDFHSDPKKRNELKKGLKTVFDLNVKKDESEAVSVINELCTFLQEKDLGYSGYSGYEKEIRRSKEEGSTLCFSSISELLEKISADIKEKQHIERDSDPPEGVNGNQRNQDNQKVYSLSVGDRRTIVEFEAEVSGEEGDTAAYIPKEFECPKCGATKSNDYLEEDPLREIIARSFGSDSAPPCPDKDCKGHMEPIEDETVWYHVYKIWAQHPLMEQDKPHQRQRQLRIIRPVDEPEEESHGLLRIRGIPAIFEMGDDKRLGVVALGAEPVDFTLREGFELDEEYEERFREVFPEIGQEKIDRTIAPQVTGRELEKEFIALLQHSPLYLPNGEFGLLNVLLAGDDTTAKTPICQDLHENLSPAGSEYTDENTTVPGLVGGAEQSTGGWSITWGALARADCGLTITEGLHAFTKEMLASIREALKSKIARVQKIHHAIRPCRSRILGTINTSVPTEYMATKFQALNHLGLDGGPQMSRIDLSRWHTVLVFGRKDVPREQIDEHKAKMADGFERPINEDTWKNHVLWAWWTSSDPDNTTVENGILTEIRNTLEKWREKYRFSDLMILSPKGFDIFYSFVISSAYLHHRVENGKVKVAEEDVDYITDLFERYFENIGLDEHERMKEEELSFADELVKQLTQNQEKLLLSLSEGSKPRSEVSNELGVAPQSVSRMLHQREEYDSTTGERYYSGAELVEGKRPLIRKRGNDYELTDYGWMVVSNYLLEEESPPEAGTKKLDTMDRIQKDKADALREIVNGFEKNEFPEGTLFVVAEEEGIEKEFVREWLKRESQGKDPSLSYSEEEGVVRK